MAKRRFLMAAVRHLEFLEIFIFGHVTVIEFQIVVYYARRQPNTT